jgi:minor extracellular protease Epr
MVRDLPTNVTRRRVLKGLASGAFAGTAIGRAAAGRSSSVFVHGDSPGRAVGANGGVVTFDYENFDFVAARVPDVAALRSDGRVSRVESDGRVEALAPGGTPGPPGGGGGGGDGSTSQTLPWGVDRIDADEVAATGSGVDVAILDTGIDLDHPDLDVHGGADCTSGGGDSFDDKNGHGTHCAGVVAALDDSQGVVGVAPGANLWAVKVLGNSGSGSWSNLVCGVDWCMSQNKEILSMSLGASSMPQSVKDALSDAYDAGHVLVAAAGNEGNDQDGDCEEKNVNQPARHPDVIGVSAMTGDADGTNSDDVIASYSSVGGNVELMAPGTDVYSTYKGGSYETLSGTSMACPHAAGLAALVWGQQGLGDPGSGDNQTVRDTLNNNTEVVPDIGDCEQGNGLIDAPAALS